MITKALTAAAALAVAVAHPWLAVAALAVLAAVASHVLAIAAVAELGAAVVLAVLIVRTIAPVKPRCAARP